jgi:hypothetical protein
MFIALVHSHVAATDEKRVFVSVGATEAAAETGMPEILAAHGYTPAQIGRLITAKMRTYPMGKKLHSHTAYIPLPY